MLNTTSASKNIRAFVLSLIYKGGNWVLATQQTKMTEVTQLGSNPSNLTPEAMLSTTLYCACGLWIWSKWVWISGSRSKLFCHSANLPWLRLFFILQCFLPEDPLNFLQGQILVWPLESFPNPCRSFILHVPVVSDISP